MSLVYLIVIVIFIIAAIILITWASIDSVKSSFDIKRLPGYRNDENLQKCHSYMSTCSIIGWVALAIVIVIVVLLLFFSPELLAAASTSIKGSVSFVTILMAIIFIIALGLLTTLGIYSSKAWSELRKSENYDPEDEKFQHVKSLIRTVTFLTMGVVVALVLAIILYIIVKVSISQIKKAQAKKKKEELINAIAGNV